MSRLGACIACAFLAAAITACATQDVNQTVPPLALADSVVATMTPREDVPYYESGMYASDDTSVAVGILRYRALSNTDGEWLLVSRDSAPTTLAADVVPFARLVGGEGFDSELWPLDGTYVAAEGSAIEQPDGIWNVAVDALSSVADLYPAATNSYGEPGLHDMRDGRKIVVGWVAGTENGVTTITDASAAEGGGNVVALIRKAGKGPPDGVYFDAQVTVVEKEPVPVVEVINGGGYSPQKPLGMFSGSSPEWYGIERHGIKDLPGGRHRVVGILVGSGEALDDPTQPQILLSTPEIERYISMQRTFVGLDDPDGLITTSPDQLQGQLYVAVEGLLSISDMRLEVDHFERIPTP